MARVIQLSGKKRKGKSTVAEILTGMLPNSTTLNYADPLKAIVAITLGMTVEELDHEKNMNPKYRDILQRFGTEAMKPIFGDNVWYNILVNSLKDFGEDTYVIIADWRFPEEIIEGSFKVRITRPEFYDAEDPHLSEVALDSYEAFDYNLVNEEGPENLVKAVTNLAIKIREHFNDPILDDA
jgi:hypothetical protein